MNVIKKDHLYIALIYFAVIAIIFILINRISGNHYFLEKNLLNWDAQHYYRIMQEGYSGFLTAFFPLFPLIWKLTALGIAGIAVFNGLMFLASFLILAKKLDFNPREFLFFISAPASIFFFLPYSEATFYGASAILLLGLIRRNQWMVVLGLFLGTMTRPAFLVFIPAIVITELLTSKDDRKMAMRLVVDGLSICLGVFFVGLIQFIYSGKWFAFFESQRQWESYLQWPTLPFTSWAGGLIVRIDGLAFLTGVISGLALVNLIYRHFRKADPDPPRELIFSLGYLSGISLIVLFFRGGSMFSLNRFVFATPFFIVSLYYFLRIIKTISWKQIILLFLFLSAFWLLFGSYGHIMTFLLFTLVSLYVLLYCFYKTRWNWVQWTAAVIVIMTNIAFQVYFYLRFLSNMWIG